LFWFGVEYARRFGAFTMSTKGTETLKPKVSVLGTTVNVAGVKMDGICMDLEVLGQRDCSN